MKVILYGLGQGLDLVEEKLRKEHEIIGYMDSFSELSVFRGMPFYKLKEVGQVSSDYIIITIQERKTAWEVYKMLINDYKLPKDCVIPFYVYANYQWHEIAMREYKLEKIQGLIFGNSHVRYGILEEELIIPFLTLAVPAQDIYCNYKIFHECISDYGERLRNLQYIIIDLYDWCYFNVDTSMSSLAIDYICWGGHIDEHNFPKNHNFQKTLEEELLEAHYILKKPDSLYRLFKNIDVKAKSPCDTSRWLHIKEKYNSLTPGPIIGAASLKRSEATIKENVRCLELLLEEIKQFNKNIKVIFTLIPRYIDMERTTEIVLKAWKKEFENIIDEFCRKYHARFWNYKNRQEISRNYMFYSDVEHLNTVGGRAMTAIFNQDLEREFGYELGLADAG